MYRSKSLEEKLKEWNKSFSIETSKRIAKACKIFKQI